MGKKIFITCGELSGDMHAADLVGALRKREPDMEFVGIGGPNMRAAGVRLLYDSSSWGTIGFFEGAMKFARTWPALRRMGRMFAEEKPNLFLPVDFRVFNMRASRAARAMGVRVAYYFAPVSWFGKGKGRFAALKETVDLALVTFPFSLDCYRDADVPHLYVGHPLVDTVKPTRSREESARAFGVDPSKPVIGIMPGSREQELRRLMPPFLGAVSRILAARPDAQFLLMQAHEGLAPMIKRLAGDAPVKIVKENRYDFMSLCDVLIACSGTATHEATLLATPMVICYKVSAATAWLARRMGAPPMIGLPNILAGEFIAPELVQEQCTAERVANETLNILDDDALRNTMKDALRRQSERLGAPGVLDRAADAVLKLLRNGTTDNG